MSQGTEPGCGINQFRSGGRQEDMQLACGASRSRGGAS